MFHSFEDTITALATPDGPSLEGIVRLSGPRSFAVVAEFFRTEAEPSTFPPVRPERPGIDVGRFFSWETGPPLPCRIYYWPAGHGFTGQESVELHLPGVPAIFEAVLHRLLSSGHVRPAEPGEFTLRAFLSGRIDLTQAEAVLGIIDAASPTELDIALAQLAGGIAGPLRSLRETMAEMLAHLEAGIDFAEEEIRFVTPEELACFLEKSAETLDRLAERLSRETLSGTMPIVSLVGAPNAGKSTLYNRLGGGAALVSPIPGTTRDYLETVVEVGGMQFVLRDTAGLLQNESHLKTPDGMALRLAEQSLEHSGLLLFCFDRSRSVLEPWEKCLLSRFREKTILVRTKGDLPDNRTVSWESGASPEMLGISQITVSAHTGLAMEELRRLLRKHLIGDARTCEVVPATAVRSKKAIHAAVEALGRARRLLHREPDESILAADVREVLRHLGEIVGAVYTEDILDRIFSRFCIGK